VDIKEFKKLPIMGILRGIKMDRLDELVSAILSSGLKTIELAMNTYKAPQILAKIVELSGKKLIVGAGTVLTVDDLKKALDNGAGFIVMPTLAVDVVQYCAKNKIPVFAGALTPQEIYNAWCLGASMVKVFPAKFFGPEYFREIKGPFPQIELLACGGVNIKNIGLFFSNGASAVAFGASIFRKDWIASGQFLRIQESIKALIDSKDKGPSQIFFI